MFDLDGYLERIGLSGRPAVEEIHRAHMTSIPFENLDPQRGVPVSLEPDDLYDKLVTRRRGGYCFEQNLLLTAALQALGAEVELFLARVRYGAPPGAVRPRGHLVLRVRHGGHDLHADVGFGGGTPARPLPFGPGGHEQEVDGWRHRVVQDGGELVLQVLEEEGWADLYGFVPEPAPPIDLETSNWWVCTNPRSPFVSGLVASVQDEAGRRTRLGDWDGLALVESTPAGSERREVQRAEVPGLLAERFALPGFELDAQERVVPVGG